MYNYYIVHDVGDFMKYNITVIIPCYNEEDNVPLLYQKIITSIKDSKKIKDYRIIYINDCSIDNTKNNINKIIKKDKKTSLISFDKRCGKSTALQCGFDNISDATDLVFMMDGDLQDDPKEFDRFISKIEEGYDVVTGYKRNRLDNVEKRLASKLYNKTINLLFKTNIHDHNCGFKCFRYNAVKDIHIYDDLHRFVLVMLIDKGYKISEIDVEHHKRCYGKSKYGLARYFVGFKDTLKMKYILSVKNIKVNILCNLVFIIFLLILSLRVSIYFLLILIIYIAIFIWLLFNSCKYYKYQKESN